MSIHNLIKPGEYCRFTIHDYDYYGVFMKLPRRLPERSYLFWFNNPEGPTGSGWYDYEYWDNAQVRMVSQIHNKMSYDSIIGYQDEEIIRRAVIEYL